MCINLIIIYEKCDYCYFLKNDIEFVPSVEIDAVRDRFLRTYTEVLTKTANPGVPIVSGLNDMEELIFLKNK